MIQQIRQRKIIIKVHNNVDNVLPGLVLLQYTISGKLNTVLLGSLLSKQRARLSQALSHSQDNVKNVAKNNNKNNIKTNIINQNIINGNDNNNNSQQKHKTY